MTTDTYSLGLSAMSAPVRLAGQPAIGVITIAGPTVRFTAERMQALGPELLAISAQLAVSSGASPFFQLTAETGGTQVASGRKPIYAV